MSSAPARQSRHRIWGQPGSCGRAHTCGRQIDAVLGWAHGGGAASGAAARRPACRHACRRCGGGCHHGHGSPPRRLAGCLSCLLLSRLGRCSRRSSRRLRSASREAPCRLALASSRPRAARGVMLRGLPLRRPRPLRCSGTGDRCCLRGGGLRCGAGAALPSSEGPEDDDGLEDESPESLESELDDSVARAPASGRRRPAGSSAPAAALAAAGGRARCCCRRCFGLGCGLRAVGRGRAWSPALWGGGLARFWGQLGVAGRRAVAALAGPARRRASPNAAGGPTCLQGCGCGTFAEQCAPPAGVHKRC